MWYFLLDLSSKTGDELIAMGNTLLALSTVDIGTVDNTAFDEAVSTIGTIKGFTREQLQAWVSKAKKVSIPSTGRPPEKWKSQKVDDDDDDDNDVDNDKNDNQMKK